MNTDSFFQKVKAKLIIFWEWLAPKLIELWSIFRHYWKKYHLTKISILAILSVTLGLSIYLNFLARSADVEQLSDGLQQTTTVVDAGGEEAGDLYSQKGTFASIDEIDDDIENAVVSTEDKRFYSHSGFDPIGIARAAVGYLANGQVVGGGSTITQQLAKNAYLNADQTLIRKLKELFLAIEIEKHYTKDEILEMYLNNSYFGKGVWGIQDASLRYFGKPASDITVPEAATLAGMLKAPNNYNPVDDYERSINRRNTVLELMATNEVITQEEKNHYQSTDLSLANAYSEKDSYTYPYYFDAVISEAVNKYGFEEEELLNRGYTIHTTLNQDYQQQMDDVYEQDHLFQTASDGTPAQGASVAMDPETGGVAALVGGRGDYTFRGFNRATQMKRQPGSIIKPLGVYAPALESGFDVDSMLVDEEITYEDGDDGYTPTNLSGEYEGEVPLYEALAHSLNAPTVWLLNEIGIQKGMDTLEEFGLDVTEQDRHLGSVALGGMSQGASPLDMASAYSTFANSGVRMEPHLITQIVDASGNVVVDNTTPDSTEVVSEEVSEDMNSLLMNVYNYGTAANNQPDGHSIAGKTGTTENSEGNGSSNHWIVGYTPDVVVSSWMGYDETNEDHYLTGYSSESVGMVMKEQMERIIPYSEQTQFTADPIIPEEETDNDSFFGINRESLNQAGEQLKEGIRGAGEQVREGASTLRDQAEDLWNGLQGR